MRYFFIIGGLFSLLAILIGAFGTHALKPLFSNYEINLWEKATYYQMIHGIAIILTTFLALFFQQKRYFFPANILFTFGILCFSGALYTIALTNIRNFGIVAPIGGISFILGWLLLIIGCFKFSSTNIIPKGA